MNKSAISRDAFMLKGELAKNGYDWWWHSFTGVNSKTKEEKSFFIEFFTCNPSLGGEEPILGQTKENQEMHRKPSYLMVKCGAWGKDAVQLHRFFGWNKVSIDKGVPFSITVEDCFLSETCTKGSVSLTKEMVDAHPEYMCNEGSMEWNLSIQKCIPFNVGYGASKPMRDLEAFEMFWHAEGMKTKYEGTVIFNGERYDVSFETSYGYADKNWGKDFTSPWVWLSSNHLIDKKTGKQLKNSAFDIGGGRPKIGHLALSRKLLGIFHYEGKDYDFNFSKFWELCKTTFKCEETDTEVLWHVEQETPLHKMVTDISCEKEDMLLVNYEAPNGEKKHNRLWNGGNGKGTVQLYDKGTLILEVECLNVGCEYGEYTK